MKYDRWFNENRELIYKEHKKQKSRLDVVDFGRNLYKNTEHYKPIEIIIDGKCVGHAEDYSIQRGGVHYKHHELFIYGFKKVKG